MRSNRPLLIALALFTGACGSDDNAPGVGGVSVGEARALNEAAEMLDNQTAGRGVASDPIVPAADNAAQ